MLSHLTVEEISESLDAVVGEILDECQCHRPPIDAFQLAQFLEITVALDDCQEGRARFVRLSNRRAPRSRAAILLRSDPRLERRQWAVAHELGEHAAYRVFHRLGVDPRETSPDAREQVANRLAGRLLVPTGFLVKDAAASQWDLLELKRRYATASHELIARRMLDCPPPVIISIYDQGRLTFRRANIPGRTPPPMRSESDCRHAVHEANEPRNLALATHRVQGWPIHEDNWKREIIRTEFLHNMDDVYALND